MAKGNIIGNKKNIAVTGTIYFIIAMCSSE